MGNQNLVPREAIQHLISLLSYWDNVDLSPRYVLLRNKFAVQVVKRFLRDPLFQRTFQGTLKVPVRVLASGWSLARLPVKGMLTSSRTFHTVGHCLRSKRQES